ncbi:MAG: hypothetical protein HGB37_02765 [Candidatus Moranbacteria bacterium]|nr:hypothetical protein [Candidatus Moranbacteria bacterium]NTW89802.1 hypothetical protein [Candidatus Moranbacteria bacterium]
MLISDEEFQQKLEAIFESAELREEDRNLWRDRLADAGEYIHKMFIDVFSKDRDLFLFFTTNMRKRMVAAGDRVKLEEIAEEERAYFSGLINRTEE